MKKLVLMAVAIVAVSFASCGNKAADAAKATADSIRIADSIAAVEAAALEAEQAAAAAADSLNADSTATETVAEYFRNSLERIESLPCKSMHRLFLCFNFSNSHAI